MKAVLLFAFAVSYVLAAMPASPSGEVVHVTPEVTPSFALASIPNAACGWTDPASKNSWDLSTLTKPVGGGDYKGTDNTYDYKMNVCAKSNAGAGCTDKNYAICQFSQAGQTFVASLGSFDAPPTWQLITLPPQPPEPAANGVQYTMTNGDICWIAGRQQTRTVNVVFRCNTVTEESLAVFEEQTTCTFTITLKAKQGCPGGGPPPPPPPGPDGPSSSGGLSGGWVFVIILLVGGVVYIGAGCLWGYKKKQVTGVEAFPHIAFWRDLPALCKDGCRWTYNMIRSGCKSGKLEQYDAL